MAEAVPHYQSDNPLTFTVATAAVTGGQLVEINGNMTVGPAGADSTKCVGVAAHDAAVGAQVTVYRAGVFDLLASGAIAAGAKVVCAAAGAAKTIGAGTIDEVVGTALEAISNAATGRVALNLG